MTAIRGRLFRLLTSSSMCNAPVNQHIEINPSSSSSTKATKACPNQNATAAKTIKNDSFAGSTPKTNSTTSCSASTSSKAAVIQEISVHEFLDEVVPKKPLVILGEYHGSEPTIQLQTAIGEAMAHSFKDDQTQHGQQAQGTDHQPKVRVIMEHFSVDMDPLLQRYQQSTKDEASEAFMSTDELLKAYNQIGTEQHDLIPYIPLLQSAKSNVNQNVVLYGGFIPRTFAREFHIITKNEIQNNKAPSNNNKKKNDNDPSELMTSSQYIQKMKRLNYITPSETLSGTDEHYNYFESLFTQRNIHLQTSDGSNDKPKPQFRTLFPAQILKDASMAWKVHTLLKANYNYTDPSLHSVNDKFFVICGVGHMLYSHGVPERVVSLQSNLSDEVDDDEDEDETITIKRKIQKEDMIRIACLPVSKGSFSFGNEKETKTEIKTSDDDSKRLCPHNDENTATRENSEDLQKMTSIITDAYGNADAADYCFIYEDVEYDDDNDEDIQIIVSSNKKTSASSIEDQEKKDANNNSNNQNSTKNDDYYIQQETKNVYDRVGSTASKLQDGNLTKAHAILKSLDYTNDDIVHIGLDAVNYQGVGNPHKHANIQIGEKVLDLGSGLGVDSIIASRATGSNGCVVGVDLSLECVLHATNRAKERGIDSMVSFVQSPIESIGSKIDQSFAERNKRNTMNESEVGEKIQFDVIISNGAFCLLPNKTMGFRECFRLLKPGGRIAICTTVIKDDLENDVEWPLCMHTFAKMEELKPMLENVGFEDVEIDLSDSLMEVELEEEEEEEEVQQVMEETMVEKHRKEKDDNDGNGRYKVHNEEGRKRFQHLDNFDMNKLCARVVLKARKPTSFSA